MRLLSQAEQEAHLVAFRSLGRSAYEARYLFYINRWRKACPLAGSN